MGQNQNQDQNLGIWVVCTCGAIDLFCTTAAKAFSYPTT